MLPKYITLKLMSDWKLNIDLITAITSTQYAEILEVLFNDGIIASHNMQSTF